MRYHQICNAGSWKKYFGEESMCAVMPTNPAPDIEQVAYACSSKNGTMFSSRTHTFLGYYVAVIGPEDNDWYTEDNDSMRNALRKIDADIRKSGWILSAIGLSDQWVETGLSLNTGYGYHPAFDRAVHMLEPDPDL
jgi:hypothetical protein